MKEQMTAIFRTYLPGHRLRIVRLKPGEVKSFSDGGPTDEGWTYIEIIFRHRGTHIERESFLDGEDCDGRLSSGQELYCPVEDLKAGYRGLFPAWDEKGRGWQRDYRAESMGY